MNNTHRQEKRHIPELLAPAGGLPQLRAAVNNGADAVYLGGARFNARAKAENFTLPALRDAVRYAHQRNVKVYVTFNTLLRDRELPDALEYAGCLWDIGVDAVIVADAGLIRLLGRYLPDLPLHLSTQAAVTGPGALPIYKGWGIRRIVPARELNLEEIRAMAAACHGEDVGVAAGEAVAVGAPGAGGKAVPAGAQASCELEVFAHGALCMCYSGQCQMSRVLGASGGSMRSERVAGSTGDAGDAPAGGEKNSGSARSGNRGLCAQPCRLPYTDEKGNTGYFLSPKDLCLLAEIPALCEAGVDSLKIEGRLKSPEYVAVVTSIYRKYLDRYAQAGEMQVSAEDWTALRQIYSRGDFTTGYLYGNPGPDILSGTSPKHTGICIGTVQDVVSPKRAGKDKAAAAGAARKGAALVDVALERVPQVASSDGRRGDKVVQKAGALQEGDGVEFHPARTPHNKKGDGGAQLAAGGRGQSLLAGAGVPAGKASGGLVTFLRQLPGGQTRIGDMKGRIEPGDQVFRVSSRALLEQARATFDGEDMARLDRQLKRRVSITMRFTAKAGVYAQLEIREGTTGDDAGDMLQGSDRRQNVAPLCDTARCHPERPGTGCPATCSVLVRSEQPMEAAQKRPAEEERIRQQLGKLGGTPFAASQEDIQVDLDGVCAVPISEINRMRREGIRQLLGEKACVHRAPADMEALEAAGEMLDLDAGETVEWAQVRSCPDILVPLMDFMAAEDPGDALPYIDAVSKGKLDLYIEENFGRIVDRLLTQGRGILIRTSSWVKPFLDAGVRVYGGYGLNVYNRQAQLAWEELGLQVAEWSLEAADPGSVAIPLMITEHPVQAETLTDRKGCLHRVERSPAGDKWIIW